MSKQTFDLRSDTFTKATVAMKEAMFSAEVGDDVFAEDPSINLLQEKAAKMFGKEAALFCPSGTMTNQIGLGVHLNNGDEVICHNDYHIFRYEGGGIAANSGAQAYCLQGTDNGKFSLDELQEAIHAPDSHNPVSKVLSIENSTNRGGGDFWTIDELKPLIQLARENNLKTHLDGARLFNALVESGDTTLEYGELFDTISICLSKGLGCPVGSLLIGSEKDIRLAHRIRKRMGGGMRQAGLLAAAGTYALDHHIERLKDDHKLAKALAEIFEKLPEVTSIKPVKTNIVIINFESNLALNNCIDTLKSHNILALPFGFKSLRLVTHYDVKSDVIEATKNALFS